MGLSSLLRSRSSDGFGRPTSPRAEEVSRDLRTDSGAAVRDRRRAAGLMLAASGAMGVVALYQFGLIRHLPEPPGGVFDADRVDASGEAYHTALTPDTALALASYGVTLGLIGMGPADRAQRHPWMPLAQAAKLGVDAASAAVLTVEQVSRHRALCSWCLLAAVTTTAALPLSLREARAAWRRLRGA